MTHLNTAIKRAIESGYRPILRGGFTGEENWNIEKILLDPKFFQCLGVAEGWKEGVKINGVIKVKGSGWWCKWHDFIDALADGKTAETFFEELLK